MSSSGGVDNQNASWLTYDDNNCDTAWTTGASLTSPSELITQLEVCLVNVDVERGMGGDYKSLMLSSKNGLKWGLPIFAFYLGSFLMRRRPDPGDFPEMRVVGCVPQTPVLRARDFNLGLSRSVGLWYLMQTGERAGPKWLACLDALWEAGAEGKQKEAYWGAGAQGPWDWAGQSKKAKKCTMHKQCPNSITAPFWYVRPHGWCCLESDSLLLPWGGKNERRERERVYVRPCSLKWSASQMGGSSLIYEPEMGI